LSQAQAQINAARAASLAAIGTAGTAAQAQLQAAIQATQADRTAALSGQLSSLQGMNAPAQFTAAESARLAQPYDAGISNLTQMGAARSTFLNELGATSGNYFDQVNASIPASRAAAHAALLNANTKLALRRKCEKLAT
jgi:hypothetical protein